MRNDLRIHDNHVIDFAIRKKNSVRNQSVEIVPVFCFDPAFYNETQPGVYTKKIGLTRTKFQIESVESLRQALQGVQSGLLVVFASAATFIPQLLTKAHHNVVVYQKQHTVVDLEDETGLKAEILKQSLLCDYEPIHGATLYHPESLPWSLPAEFP